MYSMLKRNAERGRGTISPWAVMALGLTLFATYLYYNISKAPSALRSIFQSQTHHQEYSFDSNTYLVWSQKCQIPNVNPFDESIRKLIKHASPITCSKIPPLTLITFVPGYIPSYVLRINDSATSHYSQNASDLSCCYSVVNRESFPRGETYNGSADNLYSVSACRKFNHSTMLKQDEEFILVYCNVTKNGTEARVYANMHIVVPIKTSVLSKFKRKNSERHPNVLILGYDSISRLNHLRTMPKTVDYLHSRGWIELLGYNKVAEGTIQNVCAILIGLSMSQLKKSCWPSYSHKIDDCPFIWKEFSRLGYVTAYFEDQPHSTFNYLKTGFVEPPTDYYLRPFMYAAEKLLPIKYQYHLAVCLGPTNTSEHILQQITMFTTVFKSASHFVFSWINFGHGSNKEPELMDDRTVKFFEDLKETGALNTSLVIFLSDHGMRWGEIRKTPIGWLEERLPFIYIWIPEWFQQKYPSFTSNLKKNRNRLTSPFDLHMTLKHIVDIVGNVSTPDSLNGCTGCPKCASLFSQIEDNRSCDEAGITEKWCTCTKYQSVFMETETVKNIARYVLSEINKKLKNSTGTQLCAELTFRRVIDLKIKIMKASHGDYKITFEAQPGGAVFEAVVGHNRNDEDSPFLLKGTVSRLTSYGNQSQCVHDPELRLFCYCV